MGGPFAVASRGPLICTSEVFQIFGTAERPNLTLEDYFSRVHPDDLERVQAGALSAIAQEGHYELEHRIVRPDGTQRWVFAAGDVLADANGVPVELVGVIQDITDRREAEEKARASRASSACSPRTRGTSYSATGSSPIQASSS